MVGSAGCALKPLKQLRHSRNDIERQKGDHECRRQEQKCRIGESTAELSRDADAALQIIDKSRQNVVQGSAFFARRIDAV